MSCPDLRDICVIVLAGGRSTRMGADKAQVVVDGVRLVDKLLAALPSAAATVVVSPHDLGPLDAVQVCEEPPYGGPVAGMAAGARHLGTPFVAVLAVDAPESPRMLGRLAAQIGDSDCAVTVSSDGRVQPLCALWRREALLRAIASVGERDTPAMRVLRATNSTVEVKSNGTERDYDTPGDLAELGRVDLP